MPNKSKAKGNSAELCIAKHLSTVFGLNHQRVPNSGAYSSFSNSHRLQKMTPAQQLLSVGDIIVPEECSNYSYEIKFYADIPFHSFYTNCDLLDKWLIQAKEGNRKFFLIFKANNKGFYVCFNKKQAEYLTLPENYMIYKDNFIVKLEGFFEKNKDIILKMNKDNITSTVSLSS